MIKLKRMVCFFLLSAAVFVILFPILFIFCGSMMGEAELTENLYSVLDAGAKGFAAWTLFPKDWTLESYKELFLYEPGYFTLFWNSVKISLGVLTGQILFAVPRPGALPGIGSGERGYCLACIFVYDAAFSGSDAA